MPIVLILFVLGAVSHAKLSYQEVHRVLVHGRSSWRVADTEVGRRSTEDRRKLLGALTSDRSVYTPSDVVPVRRADYPESFDWRNRGGFSFVSGVGHQGQCGACTAFAVTAALEIQLNIATRTDPASAWFFSPQHLFSCAGGICKTGLTVDSALSYLFRNGIPDASCYPYYSGQTGNDYLCESSCHDWRQRSVQVRRWWQPTIGTSTLEDTVSTIKGALLRGPVISTHDVYEDFFFYGGGVYRHMIGKLQGEHAIVIIGWNDSTSSWIVKNSWGDGWGEKGFYNIAWDDVGRIGNTSWAFDVPEIPISVYALGLTEGATVRGKISWPVITTDPESDYTGWELYQDARHVVSGRSAQAWDSARVYNGTYLFVPVAVVKNNKFEGQPRTIHIHNGPIPGEVKITYPTHGATLRRNVRTDFRIETATGLTQIVLVIDRRGDSPRTFTVSNYKPDSNDFFWDSTAIPDGQYWLSIEAYSNEVGPLRSPPVTVVIDNNR